MPKPINIVGELRQIEAIVHADLSIDQQTFDAIKLIAAGIAQLLEGQALILEALTSPPEPQAASLNLELGPPATETPGGPMATKDLGVNQHATATINPLDASGNPAQVEAGTTVFAVSDATLATVTPIDDKNATVTNLGVVGTYELTVTADADLGEGVKTISDALTINAVPGEAVNLGLSLSEPENNA